MLPIQLRFSGLNSYRQEQCLDFTPMAAAGVFGIFGPTGAGKSTILDAITLALYGKVTRSKNNAQGVINMQEKQAAVSYTFALGDATYQVERVLVRAKDEEFSARVKSCRLLRLDDNVVLASDKAEEVNAAVVELIGLRSEDFLRSIALPQGQFDKFLRLGASDRSKMLENLFGLEQYGAALQDKLKKYLEQLGQKGEAVAFQLEQLGDCSPQRFKAETAAYQKLQAELEAQKTKWEQDRLALQRWEGLAQKAEELANNQAQLEQLTEQAADIEAGRRQLELAQKTEPLRRPIKQVAADFAKLKELETSLAQQKQQWQNSGFALQQKEQQAQAYARQKAQEYEGWLARLQTLEAEKITTQKGGQLQQQLKQQQQTLAGQQAAMTELSQQKTTLAGRQAQNQQQRQSLEQALAKQKQLLQQKPLLEAGTALYDSWQNSRQLAELQQTELMRQQQKCATLFAKIKRLDDALADCPDLETMTARLEAKVQQTEAAYTGAKELESRQLAATLAADLTEGRPCPVCGSLHHPKQAAVVGNGPSVAATEPLYNRYLQLNSRFAALAATYQEETNLLQHQRQAEFQQAQQAATEKQQQWQGWLQQQNQGADYLEQLAQQLQQAAAATAELEQQQQANQQQQQTLRTQEQQLQQQELALTQSLSKAQNAAANTRANLESLGSLRPLATVEAERAELNGKKNALLQQEQQLQKELELLKPLHSQAESQYHSLTGQLQSLQQTFAEVKADLETACQNLGFAAVNEAKQALRTEGEQAALRQSIEQYQTKQAALQTNTKALQELLAKANWQQAEGQPLRQQNAQNQQQHEEAIGRLANQKLAADTLSKNQPLWQQATSQSAKIAEKTQTAKTLQSLIKGGGLVNFLAQEYLNQVLVGANQYLADFSNGRFSLELHQLTKVAGQEFMLRDAFNGGQCRPINTMSGGEIFLASLALALALSTHIQLHGKYELGFFFLDEGFGTLDPEKLETLMNAVEKLPVNGRLVGVITHVAEVKNRLPYYWQVTPATISGGSKISWGAN